MLDVKKTEEAVDGEDTGARYLIDALKIVITVERVIVLTMVLTVV